MGRKCAQDGEALRRSDAAPVVAAWVRRQPLALQLYVRVVLVPGVQVTPGVDGSARCARSGSARRAAVRRRPLADPPTDRPNGTPSTVHVIGVRVGQDEQLHRLHAEVPTPRPSGLYAVATPRVIGPSGGLATGCRGNLALARALVCV